jgi:hypothetical protein
MIRRMITALLPLKATWQQTATQAGSIDADENQADHQNVIAHIRSTSK